VLSGVKKWHSRPLHDHATKAHKYVLQMHIMRMSWLHECSVQADMFAAKEQSSTGLHGLQLGTFSLEAQQGMSGALTKSFGLA